MLLPEMLRKMLPLETAIGFFLHAPFPSSELFRCLPKRKEILKGMLQPVPKATEETIIPALTAVAQAHK